MHTMFVSTTLRVSLLLLCAYTAFAQEELPVFTVGTHLQSIAVQVTDRRGNHAKGLSASDFTLLENGRPQKVAFFGTESQPVSLAILVDSSISMDASGKLDQARAFLVPLIRGHLAEDEIFLLPFDDKVGEFESITQEQRLQPVFLKRVRSGQGGTALYDALASVLCRMRTARNVRQAVVVITDGADQHSRLDLEKVIELARSSSAQIFTVGFYSKLEYEVFRRRDKTVTLANGQEIDNPVIVFERFARESGAESFFPSSKNDFKEALDRISAIVEAQYTLAYYPESVTGLRKIEVKVNRGGAKVSARRTVGSEAAGETIRFTETCAVSAREHPYPWESRVTLSSSNTRIYHEDFSDPRSGWPNRRRREISPPGRQQISMPPDSMSVTRLNATASTSSHYVAGGYEISRSISPQAPRTGIADGVIAAYGPAWDSFRASVLLESSWGRDAKNMFHDSAVGIVFNVSAQGYYAFLLAVGEPHSLDQKNRKMVAYTLFKRNWTGMPVEIVPWAVVPANSSISATAKAHKLSVEYARGQITLLLDDLAVGRVKDTTFDGGYVGFGVFGNGRATVRDLLVEELP